MKLVLSPNEIRTLTEIEDLTPYLTPPEREVFDNAKDLLHDTSNLAGVIRKGEPGIIIVPSPEKPHPDFSDEDLVMVVLIVVGWCLSDEEKRRSGQVKPPPGFSFLRLGHEWAGLLAEPMNGYPAGTPVLSAVRLSCNHAECTGAETCTDPDEYLSFGSTRCHGALGRVVLVPKKALVLLPANPISIRYGFYGESLAVTRKLIAAVREAICNRSVKRVACMGIGGIGLPALFWLSQWENTEVFAFDIKPDHAPIAEVARRLDATYVSVADEDNLKALNNSFDFVVETSGSPEAFVTSLELLREGGQLGYLSLPGEGKAVSLPGGLLKKATLKEVQINFSVGFGMSHLKSAVQAFPSFCHAIGFDLLEQVTHGIPFSTLSNESIEAARQQKMGAKVFIRMQE